MSFSLDSLKGSLSFPLCFHWLLPASSAAGQITRYLQFKCIWEGLHVPCSVRDPSAAKWDLLSACRRWQESDRRVAGALLYQDSFHRQWDSVFWISVLQLVDECCPRGPVRRAGLCVGNPQALPSAGFTASHNSHVDSGEVKKDVSL